LCQFYETIKNKVILLIDLYDAQVVLERNMFSAHNTWHPISLSSYHLVAWSNISHI